MVCLNNIIMALNIAHLIELTHHFRAAPNERNEYVRKGIRIGEP
jgi:hypothetical protein